MRESVGLQRDEPISCHCLSYQPEFLCVLCIKYNITKHAGTLTQFWLHRHQIGLFLLGFAGQISTEMPAETRLCRFRASDRQLWGRTETWPRFTFLTMSNMQERKSFHGERWSATPNNKDSVLVCHDDTKVIDSRLFTPKVTFTFTNRAVENDQGDILDWAWWDVKEFVLPAQSFSIFWCVNQICGCMWVNKIRTERSKYIA